eukprot:scaffold89039_cov21-Tisochrysis_lutea.AAC.2
MWHACVQDLTDSRADILFAWAPPRLLLLKQTYQYVADLNKGLYIIIVGGLVGGLVLSLVSVCVRASSSSSSSSSSSEAWECGLCVLNADLTALLLDALHASSPSFFHFDTCQQLCMCTACWMGLAHTLPVSCQAA